MKLNIKKITRFLKFVRSLFPSPVPIGTPEFYTWSADIIEIFGFPDNDSVRFALATMIMHSGPKDAYTPKFVFGLKVKAGAAKQVASQVFSDIKRKQQEAFEAQRAALSLNSEVTDPKVASDVPQV